MSIILFGVVANLICLFFARKINNKSDDKAIAISMLNASGYNIGTFLLPFVQYFYSTAAIIYVVLFDIGNAIMVFSGNNAIATTLTNKKKEPLIKSIIFKCLHSAPFMTYMFILLLSFLNLSIPNSINEVITIPARANVFLSMLMIGTMLDFDIDIIQKKVVRNILISRYLSNFLMIAIIWVLPINMTIKIMLSLALCAPSSVVAAIFSNKIDSESSLSGITNTISTLISIILIFSIIIFTS
jgi:predicted permease